MKRIQLLTQFIKNGEKRKAADLLNKIYEENECRGYSAALEKLLLTETAQNLCDTIASFYIDIEALKKELFSENPPSSKDVIDSLCLSFKNVARENKRAALVKAKDYIKRNLSDSQLSVNSVAEYTGVSESTLIKLFKENEGKTAGEYINTLRVERSLPYLIENESVASAAEKSGFSSVEAYIRTFRKSMNTTPGLWKRNKLFL